MANAEGEGFDGRSSSHHCWSQGVVLSFSARRRICGQDRNVESVGQTFRECCKESGSRVVQPRLGGLVPHQTRARTKFWHPKAHWAKGAASGELREEVKRLAK